MEESDIMSELPDDISKAKCDKIVEDIMMSSADCEIEYITEQLAEHLGVELLMS